jgi:SagB-type dehydrogenase family enzyme
MSTTHEGGVREGHHFLRSGWDLFGTTTPDQQRGVPVPEAQKPCAPGAKTLALRPFAELDTPVTVSEAITRRRSRRAYSPEPLSIDDHSYFLFAAAGVHRSRGVATLRSAPSAGARHAYETYVAVFRVAGVEAGLWRYLPLDHALCQVAEDPKIEERTTDALHGQGWGCAAAIVWAAVPYRMEWRYTVVSSRLILLDAGHACQNLYLACEARGCGTCAIGAYDQDKLDALLGVDGENELAIYAATVGRI